MAVILFTVLTKQYDKPVFLQSDKDFCANRRVAFVDDESLANISSLGSEAWSIINLSVLNNLDKFPNSSYIVQGTLSIDRSIKLYPFEYLDTREGDIVIYIDSRIILDSSRIREIINLHKNQAWLNLKHRYSRLYIEEVSACLAANKIRLSYLPTWLNIIPKKIMDQKIGENGLTSRVHQKDVLHLSFCWSLVQKYFSARDQLSLPFALYLSNLPPSFVGRLNFSVKDTGLFLAPRITNISFCIKIIRLFVFRVKYLLIKYFLRVASFSL